MPEDGCGLPWACEIVMGTGVRTSADLPRINDLAKEVGFKL